MTATLAFWIMIYGAAAGDRIHMEILALGRQLSSSAISFRKRPAPVNFTMSDDSSGKLMPPRVTTRVL